VAESVGVDIVEIGRIRRAVERWGERFLGRVFTEREISYCSGRNGLRYPSLAVRFAAKEAASKALGLGRGAGVRWLDVEIVNGPDLKPSVRLYGRALEAAGGRGLSVSLSHSRDYAVAVVLLGSSGG